MKITTYGQRDKDEAGLARKRAGGGGAEETGGKPTGIADKGNISPRRTRLVRPSQSNGEVQVFASLS